MQEKYWEIAKEFEISYGHRVWSQELNYDLSLDNKCACKFLHGHNAKIVIYLSSSRLNEQGMVLDFKNLNWVKQWLDKVIDHKFILDINDPLFEYDIKQPINQSIQGNFGEIEFVNYDEGYSTISERSYSDLVEPLREKYESFVFVNFVPTSENLSKWIFDVIQKKLGKLNINVSKIEFYETPKSKSTYVNVRII
jgi:6-pyruvoyltetrahydropterin/6-carboxytetrahydropterin synthase